ncbi:MAG: type II secretion system protein GspG [Planctomycetota bacterium]
MKRECRFSKRKAIERIRVKLQRISMLLLAAGTALLLSLSGFLLVSWNRSTREAVRAESTLLRLAVLGDAILEFKADCGRFPRELNELNTAPADASNWLEGGYILNIPVDGWNRAYSYRLDERSETFDLFSTGSDGQLGGKGFGRDLHYSDLPQSRRGQYERLPK